MGIKAPRGILAFLKTCFSVLFCCNTRKRVDGMFLYILECMQFNLLFDQLCSAIQGLRGKSGSVGCWGKTFINHWVFLFVLFFLVWFFFFGLCFPVCPFCTTRHSIKLSPHIQCRDKRVKKVLLNFIPSLSNVPLSVCQDGKLFYE